MKRLPYPKLEDTPDNLYWRSLREREASDEINQLIDREFPPGAGELPDDDGVSRRSFFKLMGSSMALAGLVGCRRPEEKILPYDRRPEDLVEGVPLYFATATTLGGAVFGLLVESNDGRPTKIQGNPKHPETAGKSSRFLEAQILDLYDVDRSTAPSEKGAPRDWAQAEAALKALGQAAAASQGRGLAILTEGHRSPTLSGLLDSALERMPNLRVVRYEPFSRDNAREGHRIAFGTALEAVLELSQAKVIASFGADFFAEDTGTPLRNARGWATHRKANSAEDARGTMNRLYVAESTLSTTGTTADHRFRMTSRQVSLFALAVCRAIGVNVTVPAGLPDALQRKAEIVARDLLANPGAAVLAAGDAQPPAVHAAVAAANVAVGAVGKTVSYALAYDDAPEGPAALKPLVDAINGGEVTQLIILGGNPVFTAPADLRFADVMRRLTTSVHVSDRIDETSELATWHLNRAHFLETWSDARAVDGTLSIVQPLIAPLFDGRTDAQVVAALLGTPRTAYDLVRQTHGSTGVDLSFRTALHDGVMAGTAAQTSAPAVNAGAVAAASAQVEAAGTDLEVTFHRCPHTYDGRFANNGWLQEAPDPVYKHTWGNFAAVSPKTFREMSFKEGELVTVSVAGGAATVPVMECPGQADGSIAITVGQGRTRAGRVGNGVGTNTYPLRTLAGLDRAGGARVNRSGEVVPLARTQEHFMMERRNLVREASVAQLAADPMIAKKGNIMSVPERGLFSLYPDWEYKGHKWGMTIDLSVCTGCSGCIVACQAENNIPIVGMKGVLMSREMHWIRVDRYFRGVPLEEKDGALYPEDITDPTSVAMPVPCMHCENAPCEQVCPVAATVHSPEGLNDMAYNRCIGTKYCLNNCPYKVRRFNYYNYHYNIDNLRKLQFNPDVTVRVRGVMEKCTYCVQRINAAKIATHVAGKDRVEDGAIQTACQQGCPVDAIHFGDLNDPKSVVAADARSPRNYGILEELNVRPRTTYLARLTNPNPELGA